MWEPSATFLVCVGAKPEIDMTEEARRPTPPYPKQHQEPPGKTEAMQPVPDHGEQSYKGSGRLEG